MSEVAALKKTVCQEIRSYLTYYTAKGLPMNDLNKLYLEDTGQHIPFNKLGYSSLPAFLQSIPDVVQIRFNGVSEPILFGVPDEKTMHIAIMAANTTVKKSNNRAIARRGRPLRYHNSSSNRRPNYPYNIFNQAIRQINRGIVPPQSRQKIYNLLMEFGATGIPIENMQLQYQKRNGITINFEYFGFLTLESCLKSIPDIVTMAIDCKNKIICISTEELRKSREENIKCISAAVDNDKKSASSSVQFNDQIVTIPQQNSTSENYIVESPIEEETMSDKLKRRMRRVLKKHPNGLCIDAFLDEYEEVNGEPLNLDDIGYYTVTELVDQNSNIFGIFKPDNPNELEIIYDARSKTPDFSKYISLKKTTKDLPQDMIAVIKYILESYPKGLSISEFEESYEVNCKSKLPWRDFGFETKDDFYTKLSEYISLTITITRGERHLKLGYQAVSPNITSNVKEQLSVFKTYIPEDAATCKDHYVEQTIPSFRNLDDFIAVAVAQVESPGCFFIQLLGMQHTDALDILMNSLESFYANHHVSQNYKIPHEEFKFDLPCAAVYCKDWHRAKIVGLQPLNEAVEVFYVDYGTTAFVIREKVRFLPKKFMELPAQAIKCRLGLVEPRNAGGWTKTATDRFFQLTTSRNLQCKVLSRLELNYKKGLEVVLTDTTKDEDCQINDIMIQEGHAKEYEEIINFVDDSEREDTSNESFMEFEPLPPRSKPVTEKTVQKTLVSPPGGFVKGERLNIDMLQSILQLKNKESAKSSIVDLNNIDFSIFDRYPSKPCPNPLPNSLNPSYSSTPASYSPIQNLDSNNSATPYILNSLHGAKVQNLNQFDRASTLPTKGAYSSTFLPSKTDFPSAITQTYNQIENATETLSRVYTAPKLSSPNDIPKAAKLQNTFTQNLNFVTNELSQVDLATTLTPKNETSNVNTQSFHSSAALLQKRYTKPVKFLTGYSGHLVNFKNNAYLTSADLSSFIYGANNVILNMFRRQKIKVATVTVGDEDCPDLMSELKKIYEREFDFSKDNNVTLFPLSSCIQALQLVQCSEDLINAIQQALQEFDPQDFYWMESEDDDCSNLTPELLQEKIDQLIAERKSLLSLLQNSDPRNVENHLAYHDLMREFFYATNIQKIMTEKETPKLNANKISPVKQVKNVQAVAPMAVMSTTANPTPSIPATSAVITTVPNSTQAPSATIPTSVIQGSSSVESLVSGPPLMMPMVPNMGFSGMAPNNMAYHPVAPNLPYQQWFMPQFRPFYNQFSFYNNMNNSNTNK